MEQQDKTKLRLLVSTMINASGFAICVCGGVCVCVSKFVQRNCSQDLSVLLVIKKKYSLHAYELEDRRQIEVVHITKIMSISKIQPVELLSSCVLIS